METSGVEPSLVEALYLCWWKRQEKVNIVPGLIEIVLGVMLLLTAVMTMVTRVLKEILNGEKVASPKM